MNVAVLSLTRDRLAYSQHCFASLRENAGCEYDHFVLDQGSQDGTGKWLRRNWNGGDGALLGLPENVGISRGLNMLLDVVAALGEYDVIVKVDNDCELVTPDTLRDIAALTLETDWLLSPQIEGVGEPPTTRTVTLGSHTVHEKSQIGGIFLAAPASFYEDFRYSESNPTWGRDDDEICRVARRRGHRCGYVQGYVANHYETTAGQEERFPEYFQAKVAEGLPWP